MKNTTALTAFVLAAYLYDEGYLWVPLMLALFAAWEYVRASRRRELAGLAVLVAGGAILAWPALFVFNAALVAVIGPQASLAGGFDSALVMSAVLCGLICEALFENVMKTRDEVLAERARRQPLDLTEEVAD